MGGNIIHVTSIEQWEQHVSSKSGGFGAKGVIVDFFAEWCGPCKMVAPHFETLSTQYPEVTFLKVDVDELGEVASQCGVKAMPTFQSYFKGAKVDELVGADVRKLKDMVEAVANMGKASMGTGHKLAGDGPATAAPPANESVDDARARRLAAIEARMKAQGGQ